MPNPFATGLHALSHVIRQQKIESRHLFERL